MSKLYAAHEEGMQSAGIDINGGCGIFDSVVQNIFDVYSAKRSAIRLATNAATTILKVDQVLILFLFFYFLFFFCLAYYKKLINSVSA